MVWTASGTPRAFPQVKKTLFYTWGKARGVPDGVDGNVTPIWAKNRNIDSRIPRSNQILRLSATLANQGASFIRGSLRQQKIKWTTNCRLLARFATVDEAEFRRILIEKDAKTRVEQQMELSKYSRHI